MLTFSIKIFGYFHLGNSFQMEMSGEMAWKWYGGDLEGVTVIFRKRRGQL